MVSQLDWELFQVMRDIDKRAEALTSQRLDTSGAASSRRGVPSGSRILIIGGILALTVACLYLAYLAGFFGTAPGEKGLWKNLYQTKSGDYSHLNALYTNQSQILERTEAERQAERFKAENCSQELASTAHRLDEWKSRYWSAEATLNETLREKEEMAGRLSKAERTAYDWQSKYLLTKGNMDGLRIRYSELEDELGELRKNLSDTGVDKAKLEVELKDKVVELIKTEVALALMHVKLKSLNSEKEEWISRFHRLELSYKDLLCRLKISQMEADKWRRLYEDRSHEIDELSKQISEWRGKYENAMNALNSTRAENSRLKELYEELLVKVEALTGELGKCREAYSQLESNYTDLLEENSYWKRRCENLTLLLEETRSERDHWSTLYHDLSDDLQQCRGQIEYWRNRCLALQSELDDARFEIQRLSGELSDCQAEVDHWKGLYLTTESQLEEALGEAEHWKGLYQGLANITVDLRIGNMTVVARKCGKPSRVSADITVCVTNNETPILLFLEYWAQPLDCIWGYDSLVEDVSQWDGNCKTFRVTLDFGHGVGPYKVVARATLIPPNGRSQTEATGPG